MPRCVSSADEVMDRPLFVKREGGDFPYPQKGKRACPNPRSRRLRPFLSKNRHDPSARRSESLPTVQKEGGGFPSPQKEERACPNPRSCRLRPFLGKNRHDPSAQWLYGPTVQKEGGGFPSPQKEERACPNPRSCRLRPFLGKNRHDPAAQWSYKCLPTSVGFLFLQKISHNGKFQIFHL